MHTLCSRANLLPSKIQVIAVTIGAIRLVGHSIERSESGRELIDGVEIHAIRLLHHLAQENLLRCAEVIEVSDLLAFGSQHLYGLGIGKDEGRRRNDSRRGGMVLTDGCEQRRVSFL